jgi:hypothetical protein
MDQTRRQVAGVGNRGNYYSLNEKKPDDIKIVRLFLGFHRLRQSANISKRGVDLFG